MSEVVSDITPPIGELSSRHGWKFQPMNFGQTCVQSPLKWHNQPEKKLKDFLKVLTVICSRY